MSQSTYRSLRRIQAACIGAALMLAVTLASGQAPAAQEATLKAMLSAIQSNSLSGFVADADPAFKAAMTPQMLSGIRAQFGPRLAGGYTASFLGTLNQQGYTVYLWKLVFKDGRDDQLVTMAVRGGKVSGFFLR